MAELSELLGVLDLEPVGEGRYRAQNFSAGPGGVVFGGQLLAQSIVAGATIDPTKEVKSIHTVFARGGALDTPLDIEVEAMHTGRALASATVTVLSLIHIYLKERIKQITAGGADVVIDPVGGPWAEQALRAMRWGGRFVTVGFASGEIPRIPLNLVLLKGPVVTGCLLYTSSSSEAA